MSETSRWLASRAGMLVPSLPVDGSDVDHRVENHRDLARIGMKAFAEISKAWSLTPLEESAILGQPLTSASSHADCMSIDEALNDTILRISYILGIYRALQTIFPNRAQADEWVRRANNNPLFEGASALNLMSTGRIEDLARIREYLEGGGSLDPH